MITMVDSRLMVKNLRLYQDVIAKSALAIDKTRTKHH